jgi:hypothetical protein
MQDGLRYPEMIDISRYAKRVGASGPSASRGDIENLGVELAGSLGPVTRRPRRDAGRDEEGLELRLRELLERVRQKTPPRAPAEDRAAAEDRAPADRAQPGDGTPKQLDPARPDADESEKSEKSRRESIEDIRRAIEALQSGRRATDPNSNDEP